MKGICGKLEFGWRKKYNGHEYAGMVYLVDEGRMKYRKGYVVLPEGHPFCGAGEEEVGMAVYCHNGVTFADEVEGVGWVIGFDCAGDSVFEWSKARVTTEVGDLMRQLAQVERELKGRIKEE